MDSTLFSLLLLSISILLLTIAVITLGRSTKLGDFLEHYCCDRASAKSLRQRQHVLREIFESELKYVDGLEFVAQNFVQPLIEAGDTETVDAVFNSWLPITKLHQDFLQKMRSCLEMKSSFSSVTSTRLVSSAFSEFAPFLRLYIPFVEKYNSSLARISHDVRSNGSIAQRVDVMQAREDVAASPRRLQGGLSPLLALPFQRLCKYGLLLRELSKTFGEKPGRTGAACRAAMSRVDEIVLRVNAAKARSESGERFLQLQTAMSEDRLAEIPELLRKPLSRGALLQPSRRLLYEGGGAARVYVRPLPMETTFDCSKTVTNVDSVYFVLFSDILLVVRRVIPTKWKEERMTLLYCIELLSLEVEDVAGVVVEEENPAKGVRSIGTVLRWRRPSPWSQLAIGVEWKEDGSKVALMETLRIALQRST
jgi:hypothetical protein